MDCVFCRIVAGTLPASFVYQDDDVAGFMDLNPITPGHLLVVPNRHATFLSDLPPETGAHMFEVAQLLANALYDTPLDTEGINFFLADGEAAGQEVFHVHLHVIPRFPGDRVVIDGDFTVNEHRATLDRQAAMINEAVARVSRDDDAPNLWTR